MITKVDLTKAAEKSLDKAPEGVMDSFRLWKTTVQAIGLAETRKIRAYNDHALKGEWKGYFSVYLKPSPWRAIYTIEKDGSVKFVNVEEITHHDYRKKN